MNFDALKLILVPTDFSETSEAAVHAAVRLAQTFHAAIEVFHVDIDPALVLPPPLDAVTIPVLFESALAKTAERLEAIVADVQKNGVACTSATEVGRSHAAIVERARLAGAGLIVIGSHGRHGLSHALLGSVAEKVVQHAPCAVLVVPVSPAA
jgi:nucleotide-binding universal stress UspA family protein